jgi:hypothetical protein
MASPRPADWRAEAEGPARITHAKGRIEIDTAKGLTLWYRRRLTGPVRISFDAMPITHGGPTIRSATSTPSGWRGGRWRRSCTAFRPV